MAEVKRGKPQQWTDEQLQKIALELKYKQPNGKLTALLLERETGIGRNTWSRRMKDFIDQLNSPVHIPGLEESRIITIPTVEELFLKYGVNTIELKNEIAKLLNIISDLYSESKQVEHLKTNVIKMQMEIDTIKEKLIKVTEQKSHYEELYNQVVAESYFPHLYGRSEKLITSNRKSSVVPLPLRNENILKLNKPLEDYEVSDTKSLAAENISKINAKFDLDF